MARSDPSSHAAAGITRAAIGEAALDIVREGGVADVTMRAVAARLGVKASSLYNHVKDKAELLALLARYSMRDLEAIVPAYDRVSSLDEWIALTHTETLTIRAFYARHPGLATVMLSRASADRFDGEGTRAAIVRADTDALIRLGVPPDEARHCYEVIARWTMAAIITESLPHPHPELDDVRFQDGLELLEVGLRQRLERAIAGGSSATGPVKNQPRST